MSRKYCFFWIRRRKIVYIYYQVEFFWFLIHWIESLSIAYRLWCKYLWFQNLMSTIKTCRTLMSAYVWYYYCQKIRGKKKTVVGVWIKFFLFCNSAEEFSGRIWSRVEFWHVKGSSYRRRHVPRDSSWFSWRSHCHVVYFDCP